MSVEELFAMVKANPLCRGVTFSGGEPFCQAGALVPLAENLKAAGYELASYSGYTFEQLLAGTPEQKVLLGLLDICLLYTSHQGGLFFGRQGKGPALPKPPCTCLLYTSRCV